MDMTEYAVDTRYPGLASVELNLADARRALEAARAVREFASKLIPH